ncbi:hypothetical protein EXIGLDRAFT_704321 [Exidia glandulosa HHB12029]|uniref:Uncharacterized protein n=1 Tax=Exidia glandulosa HHB12029 TaxID=1314781 RepID=A0A165KWW6_EXIGL|nr:hypothetical protein EXIGLDRAFT_704321 [Exidia glandulosa HHB12029]
MRFTFAVLSIVLPAVLGASLIKRDTVHCGTTADATLSDCQNLVNNADVFNAAWAGNSNTCHYTNVVELKIDYPASNTACSGNCCVYYATGTTDNSVPDQETVRQRAIGLLGCGATDVNKVNALGVAADGSGVCLSNGDGE